MRLIQVQGMVASLQGKITSRLLEPEIHCINSVPHLSRSQQKTARQSVNKLAYGVRILFSNRRVQDLAISSGRVRAYARAFRRLSPHRLVHPYSLTLALIVLETLFHSLRVLEGAQAPQPHRALLGNGPVCSHSRWEPTRHGPDFAVKHSAEVVGSSAA